MRDEEIRGELSRLEKVTGKNINAMCDFLGVSRQTYYNRRNNPSSFTLGEIRVLKSLAKRFGLEVRIE